MDGRRTALIVASDEFEHPGLSRLQAPMADAEALAGVLGDPEIGGFQVEVVHNAPSHAVQAHIEDLFAEGRPDDLLLLHFSGHGLKSDSGELFFAATNTRPDRLASTAVSADFVQRCMRGSRARSIVLFLDCCYGGAFGQGVAVRAAGPANVLDSFPAGKLGGGRGRAVITASSAMEYAFEGSALASDHQKQPSVFTSAVVEGLSSGAADRDEDGLVSLSELYDYVFDRVRAQNPNQTPSRDIELQGELYVAKSRRKRVRAVPLPPDLRAAVQDANMYTRLGAVGELRARLASADPGVALGARETLEDVARSDTSYVADAAREALAANQYTGAPAARPAPEAGPPPTADSAPTSAVFPGMRTAKEGSPPLSEAEPAPPTRPTEPVEPAAPTEPVQHTEPVQRSEPVRTEDQPATRQRVAAGRTILTGGSLMLVSAILPDFVYGESAYGFRPQLAVVLLCVGAVSASLAAAVLLAPQLRDRWRWPVTVMAAVAVLTLLVVRDASADLGASDVDLGIWVALAGCLTTPAAGVVALAGRRTVPVDGSRPAGSHPAGSHPAGSHSTDPRPAVTPRVRAIGMGALIASGTAIVATFAVRFVGNVQAIALTEPTLWWAWVVPALVGLTAGILTLQRRRQPHVGPALLAGAAAAATWGLWDMPSIGSQYASSGLDVGFFLELAGLVGLVALGVVALAVLHRDHALSLTRPTWSTSALPTALALCGAVPFLRVASWNSDNSRTGYAVHDTLMAVLVVLVPTLTTMLRPPEVGRVLLLGWSCGAVGTVLDYWRALDQTDSPLFGTPYVLLALVALMVVALVVRPGRTPPDDEPRRAPG